MGLEQRISQWNNWRQGITDLDGYTEFLLFEDAPEWYGAFGKEVNLNPDRTYDSRAMDWNRRVTNQVIDLLHNQGTEFRDVIFTTPDRYQPGTITEIFAARPAGFMVVDPGPKAVEDLREKRFAEGVDDYSQLFDFLRITLVGADIRTCGTIQGVVEQYVAQYEFFAPLSEEERTRSNGRVIPAISDFGNKQSAPELLEKIRSGQGHAKTLRFQIGPTVIGKEHFRYDSDPPARLRYNPPPGLRVSVVIMTPDIFEFLNDPQSPAHHSVYERRRQEDRII